MAFIEAKDYRFFYPDEVAPAVFVEQMEIKQGTITLLVGPSGCGKTTLLRKLAGETGIRGREEGSLINQAKGCAYVWQNPDNQIVTDRVSYEIVFGLENIGMEQQQMKRRLAEVISSFGLENLVMRDTMTLSGGEKQLLNIASGLAMNPELMILDEPTSQLDPVAARRIYDLIRQINEEFGVTIVIAEQRLEDLVAFVDEVLCMADGKIEKMGEPRTIQSQLKGTIFEEFLPSYLKLEDGLLTKKEARIWFEQNYESAVFPDGKEEKIERKQTSSQDFSLKNISFRYEKKSPDVLKETKGRFAANTISCLVGGNGSGKTTLLRLMARQFRPYHGKMSSVNFSYLPQNPMYLLLEETVQKEWDKMSQCSKDLFLRFGLEGLKKRNPQDLSGGEKQRLALCVALGKEADYYFLDEPTKGMDAKSKKIFGEVLKEWTKKEKSIVMVSHDMEFTAKYADEISLLYQGEIIVQCPVREFMEENQFYTTGMNRVTRRVNPHIITIEDVKKYAKRKNSQ